MEKGESDTGEPNCPNINQLSESRIEEVLCQLMFWIQEGDYPIG